jgi:hypothetical protein
MVRSRLWNPKLKGSDHSDQGLTTHLSDGVLTTGSVVVVEVDGVVVVVVVFVVGLGEDWLVVVVVVVG